MLPVLDRYLLRELAATFLAVVLVLAMISLGGVFADLLSKIARGKLPAPLLLSQLGLRIVDVLPLLLPLGLFLSVLLTVGRLYRDSEMAVLAAAGVGPGRLFRALSLVVVPVVVLVGLASLWLAPASQRISQRMIEEANRSLLVAGLEPGRFIELPGRHSVVYLADMSTDGSSFERLFVHAERGERVDIVTARAGELFRESVGEERYLTLYDGFRVEGQPGQDDFRMMRFERNDIRVPDAEPEAAGADQRRQPSLELLASDTPVEKAELHWRLSAPLATLLLALLAVPLARSPPRASRHGALLLALLGYVVYQNLLGLGRVWLGAGEVPAALGLWWVHLPALGVLAAMLLRERRLPRPRQGRG